MIDINKLTSRYGSILLINTQNLAYNYQYLRNYCSPSKVSAVVKADCYGLGYSNAIPTLDHENCQHYFVSNIDEALSVKKLITKNINSNIYVLHGFPSNSQDIFLENNITPVINTIEQFRGWLDFAKKVNHQLRCILHINTGLNRLGLTTEEAYQIHDLIKTNNKQVIVSYIISHFAYSNSDQDFTQHQYKVFIELSDKLFPNTPKSISSSYSIFFNHKYNLDMARPGFALYGFSPYADISKPNPFKAILSYYSSIIKIQDINENDGVGYYSTWKASKKSRIAAISLGYCDGLPSYYNDLPSKKLSVYIKSYKVPVIGKLSMDLTSIDITNIPSHINVKEGDVVEIIGENATIDNFAQDAGMIKPLALSSLGKSRYPKFCY